MAGLAKVLASIAVLAKALSALRVLQVDPAVAMWCE